MFRRNRRNPVRTESSTHGERPWVYFMIDAFFLVTQFFVLTFQMKAPTDLVLPNKLPAAGNEDGFAPVQAVAIHVDKATPMSQTLYTINGGEALSLAGVNEKFGELAGGKSPDRFRVRVSYGERASFGDILPIFNTCSKLKIKQCGIQPTRDGG